ncbi:MAG: TonB-dependent vitamin B12 receptor [Thiomargarita sp.]|nr:TonB-dependent vitamin B12 receptor [Thiomargarita sp.]
MQCRFTTMAAVPLLVCPPFLCADTLAPVVVTAERVAQTADASLASMTIIDSQDIQDSQAQSLPELLRSVPGLSLSNSGGLGQISSVFLRGTNSNHVLVLIDGIKVGSATTGSTAFEHIPISQIERIEIVRGPRSSLYGSEAIGGVIQIFTKKGKGPVKPRVSLGMGSDQTYQTTLGLSGGNKQAWFSTNVSGIETQGFNSCTGDPNGGGCWTHEPDKDGYQNISGQVRAGYRFANQSEVDIHWLRSDGENEYDGSFQNQSDIMQQVLGAGFKFFPTDSWSLSLKAGRSWDEADNFKDDVFSTHFETQRDMLWVQNDIEIDENHLLLFAYDYQNDQVDGGTTLYPVTSRDNHGVFGGYLGDFDQHNIQLSVRNDDNAQFGNHMTGNLAWGYRYNQALRFTASYGTAFKAPTFNDLYFPHYSNPNLKPEESQSIEIGLKSTQTWGTWAVNLYQTDLEELIAYDADISAPRNIETAQIRGLEAILERQWAHWKLKTNVTLLDPKNKSNDTLLPRRAKKSLNISLDRKFQQFSIGTSMYAVGKRYDDVDNTRELNRYITLDLRAAYQMTEALKLQARLHNIFDKEYETASYYQQAGRDFFISVHYQP